MVFFRNPYHGLPVLAFCSLVFSVLSHGLMDAVSYLCFAADLWF